MANLQGPVTECDDLPLDLVQKIGELEPASLKIFLSTMRSTLNNIIDSQVRVTSTAEGNAVTKARLHDTNTVEVGLHGRVSTCQDSGLQGGHRSEVGGGDGSCLQSGTQIGVPAHQFRDVPFYPGELNPFVQIVDQAASPLEGAHHPGLLPAAAGQVRFSDRFRGQLCSKGGVADQGSCAVHAAAGGEYEAGQHGRFVGNEFKPLNIDMPTYSGRNDSQTPEEFIRKLERYSRAYQRSHTWL
jgi:hypothetical protein